MKLIKNGIVRDVAEERASLMKKKGWQEIDANGKPVEVKSVEVEAKIAELESTLKLKEAKILELESMQHQLPDNVMEVLKLYADMKGIEIGSASTPQGILTKITESGKA